MKNLILIFLCIITPIFGNCHNDYKKIAYASNNAFQSPNPNLNLFTITYHQWSDHNAFILSKSPIITGYGIYSDSLSKIYQGKTFYEYNGEYYAIESWADYYYWFTKKYAFMFKNPELYELYYLSNNDYSMASYIASENFLGERYPSLIRIDFLDSKVESNRLSDDKHLAINTKEQTRLKSKFERELIKQNNTKEDKTGNEQSMDNTLKNHKEENQDIRTTNNQNELNTDKPSKPTINKIK